MFEFVIDLQNGHKECGLTPYRVAKETGLHINTVNRFARQQQVLSQVDRAVAALCDYYGVEFHDAVKVRRVDG